MAELGLDRLYTYHVDAAKLAVTTADPPFVSVNAGSGPRRLALSPDEKFLYVNHETDSKVSLFAVDRGTLKEIQQIPTLPPDFTGRNTTAEIQMDKAGHFLYVSNRGASSICGICGRPRQREVDGFASSFFPPLVNRHATSRSLQPADTSSPPTSFQTT